MAEGIVVSIPLASGATEPMRGVAEVRAVPGRGLEGDRYFEGRGTFSGSPDTELTLVEARRNVVTRGVDLNGLVGEEFRVGEVLLRGARRPAEPCAHLARLVGEGVLSGLVYRGGLWAKIVTGGTLRAGDAVDGSGG